MILRGNDKCESLCLLLAAFTPKVQVLAYEVGNDWNMVVPPETCDVFVVYQNNSVEQCQIASLLCSLAVVQFPFAGSYGR